MVLVVLLAEMSEATIEQAAEIAGMLADLPTGARNASADPRSSARPLVCMSLRYERDRRWGCWREAGRGEARHARRGRPLDRFAALNASRADSAG